MANFTLLQDSQGNYSLLNIDRIGLVTEIRDGHCRVVLGPKFTIELNGEGADHLVAQLLTESELVDGTPMREALEKFKRSKSAQSKIIPFDGSEFQT
jgi:hypothetical protein